MTTPLTLRVRKARCSTKAILKRFCSSLGTVVPLRLRNKSAVQSSGEENVPSPGRLALHTSIAALDVAFSVAEAIPVLGPPLKGALEALRKVLVLAEQRFQNIEGVTSLAERLKWLLETLQKCGMANSYLPRLLGQLISLERQLGHVLSKQGIRYAEIARILAGCANEIDSCLQDFMTLPLVEMQAQGADWVTVIDPFGRPQRIFYDDMGSVRGVAQLILNRYSFNPDMMHALDTFVCVGMFLLTTIDGSRINALTGPLQPSVYRGKAIVMSVVMVEWIHESDPVRCPKCNGVFPASSEERPILDSITCDGGVSTIRGELAVAVTPEGKHRDRSLGVQLFRHITISQQSGSLERSFTTLAMEGKGDQKNTPLHGQESKNGGYSPLRVPRAHVLMGKDTPSRPGAQLPQEEAPLLLHRSGHIVVGEVTQPNIENDISKTKIQKKHYHQHGAIGVANDNSELSGGFTIGGRDGVPVPTRHFTQPSSGHQADSEGTSTSDDDHQDTPHADKRAGVGIFSDEVQTNGNFAVNYGASNPSGLVTSALPSASSFLLRAFAPSRAEREALQRALSVSTNNSLERLPSLGEVGSTHSPPPHLHASARTVNPLDLANSHTAKDATASKASNLPSWLTVLPNIRKSRFKPWDDDEPLPTVNGGGPGWKKSLVKNRCREWRSIRQRLNCGSDTSE
ncbi:hypothetical protein NMY22_g3608 [Coprinellus aureogranulatus]|nr:hypothetical protein NMY22_g3608 [Coprinellus aureogranulatus]